MRQRRVLVVLAGAVTILGSGVLAAPGAGAVPGTMRAAGSWGKAIEVPGLAALGKGGEVFSVSCGATGSCAAVGSYFSHRHSQGFVVSEQQGRWGKAIEMPASGALYAGGGAEVDSVSCGAAGSCAAVGTYKDRHRHGQGFVVVERNGRWGKAIAVPGLRALRTGPAEIDSVSCSSAGSCAAVGLYADKGDHEQVFAVSQRNGHWDKAIEVPGLGALNHGGIPSDDLLTVSCALAANCAVVGNYTDKEGSQQGFVADERNGRWGKAIELPGLGALNKGGFADIFSVSCGAAGRCVAVGDYVDGNGSGQGFVADERNGRWGKAIEPPRLKVLNGGSGGGNAEVDTVSCASAGNCAAVGSVGDPYSSGFVVSEKNGVWGKATIIGLGGRISGADSVSCASPGNCAVGGDYSNASGSTAQGWVAVERNGRWGKSIDVPGLKALNQGEGASVSSMSCPSAGSCVGGGTYTDGSGHSEGFVVSHTG